MSKFKQVMARLTTRRPADKQKVDPASDWTTRQWADLPVYHPRDAR